MQMLPGLTVCKGSRLKKRKDMALLVSQCFSVQINPITLFVHTY